MDRFVLRRALQRGLINMLLLIVTAGAAVAAETGAAEPIPNHPMLTDEWIFTFGVYYPRVSTTASLAPSGGGSGLAIDFEETLDLEKRKATPMAGVFWRVSDNWRLEMDYFEVSRDATRTLTADVQWGDNTFTAGTTVNSTFDFSDLRLSAIYSFFKRRDKELGIGLGLHVSDLKASIQSSGSGAEATDVTAPLPTINFYTMIALTDEWAFTARADWLSLSYGDYTGDVRNMAINVLYHPFEHVGFGIGARSLVIDISIDDPDWRGKARLAFQGPNAFMTVSF